eukprot:SAG22_NODE_22_length_31438_cov_47.016529_6_plen_1909_part_00
MHADGRTGCHSRSFARATRTALRACKSIASSRALQPCQQALGRPERQAMAAAEPARPPPLAPPVPGGGRPAAAAPPAAGGTKIVQRISVQWPLIGLACAQLLLGAALFVAGTAALAPPDIEEARFWAVFGKPSIAVHRTALGRLVGGTVVVVAGGAIFVHGCASLAAVRDAYLAPALNRLWAPPALAAAGGGSGPGWSDGRDLALSSRGRVLALAAILALMLALCYVPGTSLFDGNPELSKQLGTAAGDMMAVALIPLPKHSVLLPALGVPFERAVGFHRVLGRAGVGLGLLHGMSSMYDWTVRPDAEGLSSTHVIAERLNPFCPADGPAQEDGGHRRYLQATGSVEFVRAAMQTRQHDSISPTVELGRGSHGCLFNAAAGERSGQNNNPGGTAWAPGSFATVGADASDGTYGSFCGQTNSRRNRIGDSPEMSNWVLHVIAEDQYWDVTFHSWSDRGNGAFSYTRTPVVSTPDVCASAPCERSGLCTADASGGSYMCSCPAGFSGQNCAGDVDECLSYPCSDRHSVRCQTPAPNSYVCECRLGWQGFNCDSDVNECLSHPCRYGQCTEGQADTYRCACRPGWAGTNCNEQTDECDSMPCQHSGTCVDGNAAYTCRCQAGYSGVNCAFDIDDCQWRLDGSRPCLHNSECTDGVDSFTCACRAGYTGAQCENDINECSSDPCRLGRHGDNCDDGVDGYTCSCIAGWSGENCQVDIDECASDPCRHGGGCASGADSFVCSCTPGWTGDRCENNVDECASDPCGRYGDNCDDGVDGYHCECIAGWSGENCLIDIDECASGPCSHGGECVSGTDSFDCTCAAGWTGDRCELDVDECASAPCGRHGISCDDAVNSYHCACAPGYGGDNCGTDLDECTSHPCLHGGICTDDVDAFVCECQAGWSDSRCATDVDECSSRPCGANAANCIDGTDAYSCTCNNGWSGQNCQEEINLCREGSNSCDPQHSNCIHSGPGVDMCECHPGFSTTDDGVHCVQIDECDSVPCTNRARCTDVLLGYTCDCRAGYEGENCGSEINECGSNPCAHGTCADDIDTYTCTCDEGWEAANCDADVDDCASQPCEHGGRCADHLLAYSCECAAGWAGGTGGNCDVDVDECASAPCLHEASCSDGVDLFTCTCAAGWAGGQCDQNVDECASSPCSNDASCSGGIAEYACECLAGWTGANCDTNVDECSSTPCRNDGRCTDMVADYGCACVTGWAGANCIENVDECGSEPCTHGGVCTDMVADYSCSCRPGYLAMNCAEDADECFSSPCEHESRCSDGIDSYTCSCRPGWTGEHCVLNIDDCESRPCEHESTCSDELMHYACDCRIGWVGDNCAENIDDCLSSPCQHSGRCADTGDTRGDAAGYECACAPGYAGETCAVDVDECASVPCGNATTGLCLDQIANYTCRCDAAWSGANCDSTEPIILEIAGEVEQFNSSRFVDDMFKLLQLERKQDRVVVDGVVAGSVIVSFHIVGRHVATAQAVRELQTVVQAAADHGDVLSLGGAPVLAVDGRRPFVEDTSPDCDRTAYYFDSPAKNFQNFTGVCAGLCFLLLFLTSRASVRRHYYQLFIRCHISFAALGFVALAFHFDYGKLDVMAPFLLALPVDYAIRGWLLLRSGGGRGGAAVASRVQLGDSLVVLEVEASFELRQRHTEPGQYFFLRLPQLAALQWHPITIASPPGAEKFVFVIKALGDWSGGLLDDGEAAAAARSAVQAGSPIELDGPYGRLSVSLDRHRHVVLVCGGVGCTPMLSVLAHLLDSGGGQTVWFVWAIRERALADQFAPLFEQAAAAGHVVRIHCTAGATAAGGSNSAAGGANEVSTSDNPLASAAMEEGHAGRKHELPLLTGRPDLLAVLSEVEVAAKKGGGGGGAPEVAVLACGPKAMTDAAKVACITLGGARGGCRFDFHSEVFEW